MKYILVILLSAGISVLAYNSIEEEATPLPEDGNGVAVIELFTSQGCSSCPSADKVLQEIDREAKASGKKVYALSMHVDYWDNLGWKDPFSSEVFTERQRNYGAAFGLRSIYTPQMIVNGTTEFVGSRRAQAKSAVAKAISEPTETELQLRQDKDGSIHWEVDKKYVGRINLAIVRTSAENNVPRGENRGRKLAHNNIVMSFKSMTVSGSSGKAELPDFERIDGEEYELVAYLQNSSSLVISGANSLSL